MPLVNSELDADLIPNAAHALLVCFKRHAICLCTYLLEKGSGLSQVVLLVTVRNAVNVDLTRVLARWQFRHHHILSALRIFAIRHDL